jgi:hypothetical protein
MTSTNLSNLAKLGLLDPVPFSRELVTRMLASVQQRLRDAAFTQNSNETRFDCAYTAIRAMADIRCPCTEGVPGDRAQLKWESPSANKRPGGASAKLLQMVEAKGVDALLV